MKEIKQFLGLTGYYRKFVPRFADISRPLTTLTKKDKKFEWTPACQKSFDLLKETLCGEPVLKYADTSKPYTLYTDASKLGWAGVLTQSHATVIDGKSTTTDHPVAFVSGLFRGSQLNRAALMKEALAIYMSVKKLSFYLTDAQILLRSDLSCLIMIDPNAPLTLEGQGCEFGYAIFEEFPEVRTNTYEVNEVIVGTKKEIKNDLDLQDALQCIENPIAPPVIEKATTTRCQHRNSEMQAATQ